MPGEMRPHHLERMVDLHERQLKSWREVQGALAEVVKGRTVAILDNTNRGYGDFFAKTLDTLQAAGAVEAQYAKYLFKELLQERFPRRVDEVFQRFLGSDIPLTNIRSRDFTALPPDATAVIISGSAAQVSKGLALSERKTRLSKEDLHHLSAMQINRAVLTEARQRGVPTVGICYGMQVSAQAMNAAVESFADGPRIAAAEKSRLSSYGGDILIGALGYKEAPHTLQGDVPVYHQDYVREVTPRSAVLMRAEANGVIHAVIQAHDAHFTGDAQVDAQHFREVIEWGGAAVLGLQFHPELDPFMPGIECSFRLSQGESSTDIFERQVQPISQHMITLITHFLSAHEPAH